MAEEWLTYQQASERFGNSPEAIQRHSRRQGWRTQRANDGRALLLVPDQVSAGGWGRPGGQLPGRSPGQPGERPLGQSPRDADALVGELRRRVEAVEAELIQERERTARAEADAAAARTLADLRATELASMAERVGRAEGEADGLKTSAEHLHEELARMRREVADGGLAPRQSGRGLGVAV